MAKGIIVMEMPEKCMDCPCFDCDVCFCDVSDRSVRDAVNARDKPDWCPIRELPEKKHYDINAPIARSRSEDYREGWNACIKEITGGE